MKFLIRAGADLQAAAAPGVISRRLGFMIAIDCVLPFAAAILHPSNSNNGVKMWLMHRSQCSVSASVNISDVVLSITAHRFTR
jgi:hypothetical protein